MAHPVNSRTLCTVPVRPELAADLKRIARARGLTLSALRREAYEKIVQADKRKSRQKEAAASSVEERSLQPGDRPE